MVADSHQLLQVAIENDDTDLIHLILINERTLHQQAKPIIWLFLTKSLVRHIYFNQMIGYF